ncbi:MAG: hypothetical protein ABI132_09995 [Rhodanobacteraceae bacterium]
MRSRRFWVLAVGVCLLGAGSAFADDDANAPFDLSSAQSFQQQAARVREAMQPGGRYASLDARDRAIVDQKIAEMGALFEQRGSIASMSGAERVRLFNAQEEADRLLGGNGGESIRCEWTAPTGSHVPRTLCWTYREI